MYSIDVSKYVNRPRPMHLSKLYRYHQAIHEYLLHKCIGEKAVFILYNNWTAVNTSVWNWSQFSRSLTGQSERPMID